MWRYRCLLEESPLTQTTCLWWCSWRCCGRKTLVLADIALSRTYAKLLRAIMGNIHCCVLPSPRGGPAVKNEPYDRTGHANETFELPHISDREGSGEQIVCERARGYSNCMLGEANWMIDVFSSNFFSDLSNHKGTLFLHRSLSNPGKINDGWFCMFLIL